MSFASRKLPMSAVWMSDPAGSQVGELSWGERMKGGMKAVTPPGERGPDRGRCREDSVSLSLRWAEPTGRTHTPPATVMSQQGGSGGPPWDWEREGAAMGAQELGMGRSQVRKEVGF